MKYRITTYLMLVALITLCVASCNNADSKNTALDVPSITVASASLNENGRLMTATVANKNINDPVGENESPQLTWDAVKDATCYAVCMFDEDANWLHWLVIGLEQTELEQGAYTDPADYIGPYPPKNSGWHHYRIEVFALKQSPDAFTMKIDAKQAYADIIAKLNKSSGGGNNILARGHVVGTHRNGD